MFWGRVFPFHNEEGQPMAQKKRRDIYQEVTDRILEILERGTVPWHNPIRSRGGGDGWPKNLDSGKRYRGINTFLLAFQSWDKGYGTDFWTTFRQASNQGGKIRKGEKASLVTFWKLYETKGPCRPTKSIRTKSFRT